MKTVTDVLSAARRLISDPQHWCQYNSALDADDMQVACDDSAAVRWCILGAVSREANYWDSPLTLHHETMRALYKQLAITKPGSLIADFNDTSTHEEVLKFLDDTIDAEFNKGDIP